MTRQAKTVRVLVKEPGKAPEVRMIDPYRLEVLQGLVSGYIEFAPAKRNTPGLNYMVNEEGKIKDLPPNLFNPVTGDTLVGTVVLTRTNYKTGELVSLKPADLALDLIDVSL